MLQDSKAFSGFSVDDLDAAKRFYGKTLGLGVEDGPMGTMDIVVGGGTRILVYPKKNHQPATYTVLNFPVSNIDQTVDQLTKAGIKMERYDGMMGNAKADEKGVYRGEGPAIAWFKDPAGNVLSVMETPPR
jgi:predicted enzyme related to lactoylglutathione lyase